jgi:hypothetical protein
MLGAAAERAGARIEDAALGRVVLRVALGAGLVFVVPGEELPGDVGMLAGEGVKDRDVEPLLLRRLAGLDETNRVTGLGEAGRYGPASCAGSDDDVVEVGILWSADSRLLQNVLRNSISARLSASGRSVPK